MVRISILILPVLRNNSSSCVIEVHRPHGVCVCVLVRETQEGLNGRQNIGICKVHLRARQVQRERERWVRETKVTEMETGRETGRTVK